MTINEFITLSVFLFLWFSHREMYVVQSCKINKLVEKLLIEIYIHHSPWDWEWRSTACQMLSIDSKKLIKEHIASVFLFSFFFTSYVLLGVFKLIDGVVIIRTFNYSLENLE